MTGKPIPSISVYAMILQIYIIQKFERTLYINVSKPVQGYVASTKFPQQI